MIVWVAAFAALVGAVAGSFLNVCIARLPVDESIVTPRSRCMRCGHPLRWFDNFPVLSYVLLRGRCRDCGERISPLYPIVEVVTAAWFVGCFVHPARLLAGPSLDPDVLLGAFAHATSLAALGWFLIGLAVIDWQTGLLPNELTIGGLCVGLFFAGVESFFVPSVRVKTFFTPEEVFIARRFGAALAGWLLLWAIGAVYQLVRKRRGMGGGDAKMLAMIGAFLGFGDGLFALLLGITFATAGALVMLVRRRADGATRLPFGSYLAGGGLVAALAGSAVVGWYVALFH